MKKEMELNTALTKHVADLLASFRVIAAVSKWVTVMSAGFLAAYHGVEFWKK